VNFLFPSLTLLFLHIFKPLFTHSLTHTHTQTHTLFLSSCISSSLLSFSFYNNGGRRWVSITKFLLHFTISILFAFWSIDEFLFHILLDQKNLSISCSWYQQIWLWKRRTITCSLLKKKKTWFWKRNLSTNVISLNSIFVLLYQRSKKLISVFDFCLNHIA